MPTVEDALAVTVTVALTVAPFVGAVIETMGGVVVLLLTVIETPALVVLLFAVSVATAVSVCLALVRVVVFNEIE